MDPRQFKHLESIPLDEENLVLGDNPEVNIKSKACIHLGFVSLNSIGRYVKISEINKKRLSEGSISKFDFLTNLLEQFLITSLNLSTISNLDNTEITEHYRRRNISVSNIKILPDVNYCQNLLYSKFRPWSSIYGSLGYYNVLAEEFEEYYTPSEIIYYSSKEAIQYSRKVALEQLAVTQNNNYRSLAELYTGLYKVLDEDSENSDEVLYSFSSDVITKVPMLALIYRDLNFYSDWLYKVYNWYINKTTTPELVEDPKTNKERATNTLLKIIEVMLSNALDGDSFTNLGSKFIRQNIDSNLFDIFDELNFIRRSSTYIKIDQVSYNAEEELINEFFEVISINTQAYKYREGSHLLLSSVIPPGGYAMLLNLIGCNLLNRAYILSHKELTNPNTITSSLVYNRILKLIGLAAICFTKTNISHIVSNGSNLLSTFKLNLTNIQINNLLDT